MDADSGIVAYADEARTTTTVVATPGIDVAAGRAKARPWVLAKRIAEPVLAFVMLLALLPPLLLIAVAIRLDSRGPVLFRQRRQGLGMREFTVFKFRTMAPDASPELHRRYIAELMAAEGEPDGEDGELKKLTNDPRVTRVGAFLRRTSLDELPQLLNVVAGQMSLVGPRPAIDYELDHYDAIHFDRFLVRPGLTGLWQVSGRNELGFRQMLELDARYARESGPVMDLQILMRTPIILLRRRAA